jgi:hypothetical protein
MKWLGRSSKYYDFTTILIYEGEEDRERERERERERAIHGSRRTLVSLLYSTKWVLKIMIL